MSELLKRMMLRQKYMAPEGDGDVGGGNDLDDDDDLEDDHGNEDQQQVEQPKPGEQEDGSVVIELEDEEDQRGKNDQQQQQAADSDEEKELEAKREARRKERQEKKQRQREREESQRRELAAEREARKQLEARLAAIEGKDRSRELAEIDEGIRRAANQYNTHKQLLQQAHEQHDGAAAAEATEKMLAAREQHSRLTGVKQTMEQSQRQQANGNPALDPRLVSNASKFMEEHSWYRPGSTDRDTLFVRAIDDELAGEGWDPKTPEYWTELRTRVKKFLPHRFAGGKVSTNDRQQQGGNGQQQRKNVVAGSGDGGGATNKGTYKLSADRVAALKEAGMWDDPKLRGEAIKRYREYDKQNSKG